MTARAAVNLVLAAVVAVLVWLALRPAPDPAADGLAVSTIAPASVQRIRIQRPGRPAMRLARRDGTWYLDAQLDEKLNAPIQAPADAFRVQTLLGLLGARSDTGFRGAGNALAQYGLDPPLAELDFDGLALRVGGSEPVSGRRYLLDPGGDQVHLLEDHWFSQIFGDAAAWVDPHPLPQGLAVVGIELPQVRWRLTDRRWRRQPADPASSAAAGAALADAWRRARALSVRVLNPREPWSGEAAIALDGQPEPLRFRLAVTAHAVLLGQVKLGVQYRFLIRQGRVLLARGAAD